MAYYYDRGYINVAVTLPAPSATATFEIKEGDQFRVGKLSIKDASPADQKKWLALLGVKKGDVFKPLGDDDRHAEAARTRPPPSTSTR